MKREMAVHTSNNRSSSEGTSKLMIRLVTVISNIALHSPKQTVTRHRIIALTGRRVHFKEQNNLQRVVEWTKNKARLQLPLELTRREEVAQEALFAW